MPCLRRCETKVAPSEPAKAFTGPSNMKTISRILLFLCVLLSSTKTYADTPNCPNIHSAVQIAIIQRDNLTKKLSELEEQFKDLLERDIDAQADGILDSFHRNEAKKVYFAKKKLTAAIDKKKENIESLNAFYCQSCKRGDSSQEDYCRTCPKSSECEAADL